MRLVVQRVKGAILKVDDKMISEIERGLVVYFGVKVFDDIKQVEFFAKKVASLRIFEDENEKMNLSVQDIKGEILVISQFTLIADVAKGNRPSFIDAERPEKAEKIYLQFVKELKKYNISIKTGVFGADMQIKQHNDGPVTIIY